MADEYQLKKIKKGVDVWNDWKYDHPTIEVDLSNADLRGADLSNANLVGVNLWKADLTGANLNKAYLIRASLETANLAGANLSNADLSGAILTGINLYKANLAGVNSYKANLVSADLNGADLTGANLNTAILAGANMSSTNLWRAYLSGANLSRANLNTANLIDADLSGTNLYKAILPGAILNNANLTGANLTGANLTSAHLTGANLWKANLNGADLCKANLQHIILVETNLDQAILSNCKIYGLSAWGLKGTPKDQSNLIITPDDEAEITVDNIQVAQFIYLLYDNPKIRDVISTLGKKSVLILGRFTPERKVVLEAIKQKLREKDFLPILFDFEKAPEKDFTETVKILAGLSRFVIADLTSPSSIPLELKATVPNFMIPFVPIIQMPEKPFSMFTDLQKEYSDRLLDLLIYPDTNTLIKKFEKGIINRAEETEKKLMYYKAQETMRTMNINDL